MGSTVDPSTLRDGLYGDEYEQMPHDGMIAAGDVACSPYGSSWIIISEPSPDGSLPESSFAIGAKKFVVKSAEIEKTVQELATKNGLSYRRLPSRDMDGVRDALFQFRE